MILKEKSYPNFRMIKSSSCHKNISSTRKSSIPIKSKVPIFKKVTLEDIDLIKRFGEEACKWLSSGAISLENVTFSMFSDPSLDEWLFFLLSLVENPSPLLNKYIACFDGSKANPIEEAYLALKKTISESDANHILLEKVIKEDEEEVVAWLRSPKSDETDSIVSCSLRNCNDLKKHFFLSLVNLDEESCWWDSDTDSDEYLSSSSSFSSISKTVIDKKSESSYSSDCVSDDLNFRELEFNEPLVWPFDKKWNWRDREGKWDDFFVMSPRRQKHNVGLNVNRSKHINGVNEIQITKDTLRRVLDLKSSKISLKVVPIETVDLTVESTTKFLNEKCKTLEDELFYLCGKHAIESFLGLEEFDGREGIEKGLWKDDDFYFQDLL